MASGRRSIAATGRRMAESPQASPAAVARVASVAAGASPGKPASPRRPGLASRCPVASARTWFEPANARPDRRARCRPRRSPGARHAPAPARSGH